ncbi:MAG: AEC family transporter [Gammaproteobacteria bacterium]|nr:AEC family transporter [Gammaproteobacteria bacterium]
MQTVAFIVGFFLVGYLAKFRVNNAAFTVKWLNNYIIYLAMPSIILLKIPALEFDVAMLLPAAFAWTWALLGGLSMLAISRLLSFPKPLEGAAILLAILGNTSFLGYPMVQAFFDDEVLSYAIFYDQLGSFLMLSTAGLILIAIYAPTGSGHTVSLFGVVKRVFTFPPFLALIVASFLPIEPAVSALSGALTILGQLLMPMALVVIGLQFQPQLLPEHRAPLICAIGLKMLAAPMLAILMLKFTTDNPAIVKATIFEAAMPCMITPGIMAIQAGLSPRFCATLLGYSTLLSFVWLPLIASWL